MLAFGLTLLVSVTAPPPPSARAAVTTSSDETTCETLDSECPDEVVDVAAPATILDCKNPFIVEMFGSCDLPTTLFPSLHLPTLRRAGSGLTITFRTSSGEHLTIGSASSSSEATLVLVRLPMIPPGGGIPLAAYATTRLKDAPRHRLDRPPRL